MTKMKYLSNGNQRQQPNKAGDKEKGCHPSNSRFLNTCRIITLCVKPCLLICPPIQTQEVRPKTTYSYTSSVHYTHYHLHKHKLNVELEKDPPTSYRDAIASDRTSLDYGILLSSEWC